MAVYFNDLTLDKVPQQNCMLLRELRNVFASFSSATDGKVKRLIANDAGMAGLWDAVAFGGREEQTFVCTFVNSKFKARPDDDYSDDSLDYFNGAEYRLKTQDGDMIECQMMGWASLNRSLTLGLRSSRFWEQLEYDIEEESLEEGASTVSAICITKENQVSLPRVQGWIVANREFENVPEPTPCMTLPEDKEIWIRDDHGREILQKFAERLVRHKYVERVWSIPYKPKQKEFIDSVYDDGTVDLRLHWTSQGLGVNVKTVGIDWRQTRLIAEILKDKYDKRS